MDHFRGPPSTFNINIITVTSFLRPIKLAHTYNSHKYKCSSQEILMEIHIKY